MPASFKFILAPRPDREGLHDVRLRIIAARVVRYLNVPGVAVAPKHWNEMRSLAKPNYFKTSHRQAADLEATLLAFLARAQKLGREQAQLTADELKELLATGADLRAPAAETEPDFLDFAYKSHARDDEGQFTVATCESRRSQLNKLAAWWGWEGGQKPLPTGQLTEETLSDFEAHLKRDLGNGPGTRRKALDVLSIYIGRAIKRKVLPRHLNPLDYYDLPQPAPKKVWLTETELHALATVKLPAQQHLARTTYFIQYYLHGSRIGVVLRLKWKQRAHGTVRFTMDKGEREKLVEESPQLTALLDSLLPADGTAPDPEAYMLPWLYARYEQLTPSKQLQEMKKATAAVNMNLKRIAVKAGITARLSSHSSRRTLADDADNATGDLGLVQGLLGHHSRSTTEKYTRGRDTPAVQAGARKVYENRPMPEMQAE
jgi:integrase/recombinase XerD